MSEQPHVFIVTTGSYSDYRIHSVWTSRAAAETQRAKLGAGDVWLEEWVLNALTARPALRWVARVDRNTGELLLLDQPVEQQELEESRVWAVPASWPGKSHRGFLGEAYGRTPDQAMKVLHDLLAEAVVGAAGIG